MKRHAGIACDAEEILITSGSLQAIDLVNTLFLSRGDTVLIEQATYGGSLSRLARLGVNAVGIPLDGEGMRMDALAAALEDLAARGIRPKYIYTIPTVQNPTGAIMSEARRAELLALSRRYGVPIFEDECYSDLIWTGKRPRALYAMAGGEGVIHIGSFSKSVSPALRVGYLVARWDILSRLLPLKTDAGSGALEQMLLGEFCPKHFDAHVPKLRAGLRAKLETLMEALGRAVRHGGRVRRAARRHLPVGEAARQRRYAGAGAGRARRGDCHQSRPRVGDGPGLRQEPPAPVLRQPVARDDTGRRRRPGQRVPSQVRRAGADCQRGSGLKARHT